jgi:DNA-binding transcriptional regulator of glucitol operon
MHAYFWLLAAVAAGWAVQSFLTFRQSMDFNDDVRKLRTSGTLSVGVGGKRYRGGRAYVAIAVDDRGIVRGAITLRGFTTFARACPLPALVGMRVNKLAGDRQIPDLSRAQREAATQAATFYRQGKDRTAREADSEVAV